MADKVVSECIVCCHYMLYSLQTFL